MADPNAPTRIFLKPGEACITSRPVQILTILGSCVSVIFYAPGHGTGAMCHAMYPNYPLENPETAKEETFYVDRVIPLMLARFDQLGIPRQEIKAYLFGGSPVIHEVQGCTDGRLGIGERNHDMALRILGQNGFTDIHTATACPHGHRLTLDMANGKISLEDLAGLGKEAP